VEEQVSGEDTSNPAVWQIFIPATPDFAMKMMWRAMLLRSIAVRDFL
jgi:hypothetical protein